ncbi:MAG: peptidase S41 [Anaerolineales bacterium]|nr:peptidase S41 [Anaerolineales bacterium]
MKQAKWLYLFLIVALFVAGCSTPAETEAVAAVVETEAPPEPSPEPTQIPAPTPDPNEPVQVIGDVEVSNALIVEVYFFERFAMLEDLTGFVQRDYEYEQPLVAQILGPVVVTDEGGFAYTLNLPAAPISPLNDVDNNGAEDAGVQIWQIAMSANYMDDPFLGKDETGGWSANYTSAQIDSENKNEIKGGALLIWSPDDEQAFPNGFGEDGLLFTEDDPVTPVAAGYSFVDLDSEPFEIYKETTPALTLYEGELTVNDYSEMTWSEGFDALHAKVSVEYPFTEMKALDWPALYAEIAPRIADAEASKDETAYFLALRDYAWAIPDGHVGLSFGDIGNAMYESDTAGGYGFAIIGLDDGNVMTHIVLEDGPAAEAGMLWGAQILEWNGQPINDAIAAVVPWSMPFSTEESLLVQQYRYLLRTPVGTEAEVTFQNPGEETPITATLTAVAERDTFTATSIYAGFDFNSLPVEYKILENGYGYIKIASLSDDINLIIRLWEWAIERMIENEVPAIIVDMRQNSGGSPLGTLFASYFVTERMDISRSYYYSETSGEFETYGPPDYTEPDDKLYYDGQLGVLVSPACASACEDVAYVLGELPQTRVFGYYASNGIFGEVARGQYELPGGYSLQAPTGLSLDMEGDVVIEGTGVAPDVRVPLTVETVQSQFVDGEDVILDYAIEVMEQPLGAGVTPEYSPTMGSKSEAETAFQAETKWLEDFAQEDYQNTVSAQAGETYIFTVPLPASRNLMWVYAWCTADEASFEDNWSKISLEFAINGEVVPFEDFAKLEGVFSGDHCRAYYTVLSDWAVGEHVLATTVTFAEALNDGMVDEDYPAGTHVYEYHVFIAR